MKNIKKIGICLFCFSLLFLRAGELSAAEATGVEAMDKPIESANISITQKEDGKKIAVEIQNRHQHMIAVTVSLHALHAGKWKEVYSDVYEESDEMARLAYNFPKGAVIKGFYDPAKVLALLRVKDTEFRVGLKGVGSKEIIFSKSISYSVE